MRNLKVYKYVLVNKKTKKYFKGYQANKPIWTDSPVEAAGFIDVEILRRTRKRLACQSQIITCVGMPYKSSTDVTAS